MSDKILMNGNEALAEGAIRGGCDCYFGYPITPQNELTTYMANEMPAKGRVFVQAESEIAAINMVYGAAATGAKSMTSSSSPGMSLKQEGISYICGAQLPILIVNVQRGGPGLGNIDPSQADYFQSVKGGGHGDYRMLVLAPNSVQEMHDFALEGFELADKYRIPVMILSDGRIGQMMEPLVLREPRDVRTENLGHLPVQKVVVLMLFVPSSTKWVPSKRSIKCCRQNMPPFQKMKCVTTPTKWMMPRL